MISAMVSKAKRLKHARAIYVALMVFTVLILATERRTLLLVSTDREMAKELLAGIMSRGAGLLHKCNKPLCDDAEESLDDLKYRYLQSERL